MVDEKMIITIGREHGTMGDKVAEKIRRQFELPLYDKAHLLRIVEETDDYDELNAFFNDRKVNSLLYAIAMSENVSSNDVPFGIIKKIIGNTGGVVMDSCGNYLFRERPNTVRIFMHADKNIRIKNLMKYLGISKEQAEKENKFEQIDLFTDYSEVKRKNEKEKKERNLQRSILDIKKKYGKNAILKGMNFEDGGTTIERNEQVGGHKG